MARILSSAYFVIRRRRDGRWFRYFCSDDAAAPEGFDFLCSPQYTEDDARAAMALKRIVTDDDVRHAQAGSGAFLFMPEFSKYDKRVPVQEENAVSDIAQT